MRFFYSIVLFLMLPFVLLRLLWRSRLAPAYRERWYERFGKVRGPYKQDGLWVHAVSVGEVLAVAPLVRHLIQNHPSLHIHITTTTPTGSAQVQRLFGVEVSHSYAPYDIPLFLMRFLDTLRPKAMLMVETEVWPNLLHYAREREVTTLLANARLSARSLRRYQRVESFAQTVFALIDHVAAQTEADADRLRKIGVKPGAIHVTGSIKFDVDVPASVLEQSEVMRRMWSGRPVWVAGSTHDGEESVILEAHQQLIKEVPDALLVLVPRHPERFDAVGSLAERYDLEVARRSLHDPVTEKIQVYLGDTMGELNVLIGAVNVAFIGGSFAKIGGHNVLEAAAQGIPVIVGPHTFNFELITRQLIQIGGAERVYNAEELAKLLQTWLTDAAARVEVGEAGQKLVADNRGALDKLEKLVEKIIA
jgi:3-deoxy-D-manno-octulosonic-acid transferase